VSRGRKWSETSSPAACGHLVLVPEYGSDAGRQRGLDGAEGRSAAERPDGGSRLLVQRPRGSSPSGTRQHHRPQDPHHGQVRRPQSHEAEQQGAQASAPMPRVHDLFRDDRARGASTSTTVPGEAAAGILDDHESRSRTSRGASIPRGRPPVVRLAVPLSPRRSRGRGFGVVGRRRPQAVTGWRRRMWERVWRSEDARLWRRTRTQNAAPCPRVSACRRRRPRPGENALMRHTIGPWRVGHASRCW
jgi:hypothetical protein